MGEQAKHIAWPKLETTSITIKNVFMGWSTLSVQRLITLSEHVSESTPDFPFSLFVIVISNFSITPSILWYMQMVNRLKDLFDLYVPWVLEMLFPKALRFHQHLLQFSTLDIHTRLFYLNRNSPCSHLQIGNQTFYFLLFFFGLVFLVYVFFKIFNSQTLITTFFAWV